MRLKRMAGVLGQYAASRAAAFLLVQALCLTSAHAQDCDLGPAPKPEGFPDQPINIFIPRSSASGSLGLSQNIAEAIEALTDEAGTSLGIKVNTLFKYGGGMNVALDYFNDLPPNGYNVIQLTDTYASQLASSGEAGKLVPLSLAQVTFSQLYIRTDETRFTDLNSFLAYAARRKADEKAEPVRIALFGTAGDQLGQEDFLLRKFIVSHGMDVVTTELPGGEDDPAKPQAGALLRPEGFESGSERYFSLFDQSSGAEGRIDALIEQPGDVARLISGGLLRPIFTFLPGQDVSPGVEARLNERLGGTAFFPESETQSCEVYYRFRGFFVPQDIPEDRRRFLEWIFRKAVNSPSFAAVNHEEYMDILYPDKDILDSYCSTAQLDAFFQHNVREYRACLGANAGSGTSG